MGFGGEKVKDKLISAELKLKHVKNADLWQFLCFVGDDSTVVVGSQCEGEDLGDTREGSRAGQPKTVRQKVAFSVLFGYCELKRELVDIAWGRLSKYGCSEKSIKNNNFKCGDYLYR